MRLLKFSPRPSDPPTLTTSRLVIRRPASGDFETWAALRRESQTFLRPFEPTWARDELSRSAFRARLRRHESEITAGRSSPWFLFDRSNPNQILGGLTVSNIRRGVSDSGTLGYWMGEPHAGKGYMTEAVHAVCQHMFSAYHLHRIEAATILRNQRSQKLLEKCSFQREGVARAYLKINGVWEDHYLFARLSSDGVEI